jgi:hypothetical protein
MVVQVDFTSTPEMAVVLLATSEAIVLNDVCHHYVPFLAQLTVTFKQNWDCDHHSCPSRRTAKSYSLF